MRRNAEPFGIPLKIAGSATNNGSDPFPNRGHRVMLRTTLALVVGLVSFHARARADGLVYRLPEDGTAAVFSMEMQIDIGDNEKSVAGSLRVSSVGTDTVDGKACRWIELRMKSTEADDRVQDKVAKLLIPEEELRAGGDPISAVIRAWEREEDDDPKRMDDPASTRTPIPAFLSGPLENPGAGDDEAVSVEGLGNLDCKTITGRNEFGRGKLKVEYTTARSDRAPFGVAKCTMDYVYGDRARGQIILLLEKVEKNAESAIPDRR